METAMKPHALAGVALLSVALLLGAPALSQTPATPTVEPQTTTQPAAETPPEEQPAPPAEAAQEAAPEAEAAPLCSDCHDQAATFHANPHARGRASKGVVANELCTSCHGDGTAHIEAGGDPTLIYKPVGLEGSNKTCLSCHDVATDRVSHHAGVHANSSAVNCLTCHSIHNATPRSPHLLLKPQSALCSSCHATQSSSLRNKPFAHRIGRGGMECSSCHEPHGRPGRENVLKARTGEMACVNCHAAKRGPHVFEHGGSAIGDCTTCHQPHGSSNPKQLKRATVAQLCLECHSPIGPGTLGSQPPSFHNLSLPRYQNCTTCHVAVHGSNRDPQLLK
jgi:DmsE family decaheme c-type cytochrome